MTFLAPWALWAAGMVSAAVIALHILASRNPRVTPLPTTRFIPDVPLRATSRALRLTDVPLMLLRVAAVMLVGVAFARPVLTASRRAVGRIVIVDRSRAVASAAEASDSAARLVERGDVLVAFDSGARVVRGAIADSLRPSAAASPDRAAERPRGSISAALAAAMRTASAMRGDADSVELVLVSPLADEEMDAATAAIRAAWPGRVRLVRVAGANRAPSRPVRIEVTNASLDDPVRAAASLLGGDTGTSVARIDRGSPASADTTWASSGARVLVRWPAAFDSSGWRERGRADTASAVVALAGGGETVVVSNFARTVDVAPGRAVALWADGSPAATERALGAGCVRDVAIPLGRAGDLALRESMRRLVGDLAAPCGGAPNATPASDSARAMLRGTGPLAATRALEMRSAFSGHLTAWLLAAALALLLLEPLLRRQRVAT
jgi:aerotolerance regulator-like protein